MTIDDNANVDRVLLPLRQITMKRLSRCIGEGTKSFLVAIEDKEANTRRIEYEKEYKIMFISS